MSRRLFTVMVALAVAVLLGGIAVLLRERPDVSPPRREPVPHAARPGAPDAARPTGIGSEGRGAPPLPPALPTPTPMDLPSDALPSQPPWLTADGRHPDVSPSDRAIHGLAAELAAASGPELYAHATGLVAQAEGGAALVGVAALARWPVWDADVLESVARHADAAIPLFALQALRDAGRWDEAAYIESVLAERLAEQDWLALARGTSLPGTAWRGLIGLSREQASPEQHSDLLAEALLQTDGDYAGRMHALLEMRRVMPFEPWRETVRAEQRVAEADDDALWLTGLQRLEERSEGPAEVHAGPPVITTADIDRLTARAYPAMYEDLALHLAFVLDSADGMTGPGVHDRLVETIEAARAYPLDSGEAQAVDRIETLLDRIDEQPLPAADAPPPGIMG